MRLHDSALVRVGRRVLELETTEISAVAGRFLPVLDHDEIVGVVHLHDLMRAGAV